jgi:hypothetical protein
MRDARFAELDRLIAEQGNDDEPPPVQRKKRAGRPRGPSGSLATARWRRLEPIAEQMRQKYGKARRRA